MRGGPQALGEFHFHLEKTAMIAWIEFAFNSDGTVSATDVQTGYRWLNVAVAQGWFEDDGFERARLRAERHVLMRRFLGAVIRDMVVRYWPVTETPGIKRSQVARVRRVGFFADCRDWTRGRHWDRRRRYGIRQGRISIHPRRIDKTYGTDG